MGLMINSLLLLGVTGGLTAAEKKTSYGKLEKWKRMLITGILFGLIACFSTDYGLQYQGSVINLRDAAPLCAGLLFGGPAGILAGVIGAVYRFFWGASFSQMFTAGWLHSMFFVTANGGFTRMACTVGTLFSGFFSSFARHSIFDRKVPTIAGAFGIGVTTEAFHMVLVFLFRLDYLKEGAMILMYAAPVMILGNALITMLCTILRSWLGTEKCVLNKSKKGLTGAFRSGIMITIVVSFFAAVFSMIAVQYNLTIKQSEEKLTINMNDLKKKIIMDGGTEKFIQKDFVWHVGESGGILIGETVMDDNDYLRGIMVLVDGDGYKKGDFISLNSYSTYHPNKTAENFFITDIRLHGQNAPVFGMYMIPDRTFRYIVVSYLPVEDETVDEYITVLMTIFCGILIFAALYFKIFNQIKHLVLENLFRINADLAEITRGNLDVRVNVRSHDEFAALSDDINSTVDTLKRYIEEAASRFDKELELARSIQNSSLPRVFPPYPNRTEFEIYAYMSTAKEVGGDFYDFFFTDQDTLNFTIADVSGKGVPAALFMMTAKTLMKTYAEKGLSVQDVFTVTNKELCENNDAGMFVTAFSASIDLTNGLLSYCNAGHNPPLLCRAGGRFEYMKPKSNFILAGMEGISYRQQEMTLHPGDILFLYTDGVTEATAKKDHLYGEQRLNDTLNRLKGLDMESLCREVKKDVDDFTNEEEQFDDITMLAFKYKGLPTIYFPEATLDDLGEAMQFIEGELERHDCPPKICFQLSVAVEELFANIVSYAYPGRKGPIWIKVNFKPDQNQIRIRFIDEGTPYNPVVKEDPDVTLSAEEREIGGLGIFMVKQTMDDMRYKYENGKNMLTITKQW